MIIFFQELLLLLFLWLLKLIDGIMEIFSAIAGVATVNYQGQELNILDAIIMDSSIGTVFWCVFILAVGLTCMFAIVGLIKNMVANNRNVSSIMGKFFLALLGTMAMLTVVMLGILISNALLKLIFEIFQLNENTKLSSALFNACVTKWNNGYTVAEFNVDLSVSKIFGTYDTTLFGIWPANSNRIRTLVGDGFFFFVFNCLVGVLFANKRVFAVVKTKINYYAFIRNINGINQLVNYALLMCFVVRVSW